MRIERALLLCTPALLAWQCGPNNFNSEEGQWSFEDTGLMGEPTEGLSNGQSVLPDERVCPGSPSYRGSDDPELSGALVFEECVEQSLEGPASFEVSGEKTCIAMEGAGEVQWLLEPVACDVGLAEGEEPVSDRVVFTVADGEAVTARVLQWMEEYALDEHSFEPPGALSEDDLLQPGETLYVLADRPVRLYAQLWDADNEQAVAWRTEEGQVSYAVSGGYASVVSDLTYGISPSDGWIGLELTEGARVDLGVEVRGQFYGGATVEGVSESALASLELVAVYDHWADEELGIEMVGPHAARAVFRDEQGRQIFGVPVRWSVTGGQLAVESGGRPQEDLYLGPDYASLGDSCSHPRRLEGERSATLHAAYGDLDDKVKLSWEYSEGWMDVFYPEEEDRQEYYDSWEPSPYCLGFGCTGCSTRGRASGLAWVLGFLGLLLAGRRRR